MRVTKVLPHKDGGHVVVTDSWMEAYGRTTPFFIYVEDGNQLLIKGKGFVFPKEIFPGEEIDKS